MNDESRSARWTTWSGGLVLVLALVGRLANLGGFSMGHSEIVYMTAASDLFAESSGAPHPPASWFNLDRLWTWACSRLSEAELARRLSSIAFGVMTVLWLWRWTMQRWGPMPALFVGLLAAISPLQVRYHQEIAPYAMAGFFAVVAVSSLDGWLESPTRPRLLRLGVALAGTALSWPLLLVVLGPTLALMAEDSWRPGDHGPAPQRWVPSWFSALLLVAPTAAGVLAARFELAGGQGSPPSLPRWSAATVTQRLEELTLGAVEGRESLTPTGVITVVLLLLGAGGALRTQTGRATLGGAIAGTVGIEAVLWFQPDPAASRHLLGANFLLILVALGAHRLASATRIVADTRGFRRLAPATVAVALLATLLAAQSDRLRHYHSRGRPQWEWIARVVDAVAGPDDVIVATDESMQVALNHYLGGARAGPSSQIALVGDSRGVPRNRPGACIVVVSREEPAPRRSRRRGDRWLEVAADESTGARVYVSRRADCLRTPPLDLRERPSAPLRWLWPS